MGIYRMQMAITRQVSRSIAECELTFLARQPIDLVRARHQHSQYEAALQALGLAVLSLPEEPDLPDAVFVEDAALVLDECAIILRPGAPSRLPEAAAIAAVMAPYRTLRYIEGPATMDGGDILRVGNTLYVGVGQRTSRDALQQLRLLVSPLGYEVRPVVTRGCLHLKSAATEVAPGLLLVQPEWIEPGAFPGVKILEVDPSEPYAANALKVGEAVLYPASYPSTLRRLHQAGIRPITVEADELAKAEGALTCCSLIFNL